MTQAEALAVFAYIVAGVLFILCLRGLSSQETAGSTRVGPTRTMGLPGEARAKSAT